MPHVVRRWQIRFHPMSLRPRALSEFCFQVLLGFESGVDFLVNKSLFLRREFLLIIVHNEASIRFDVLVLGQWGLLSRRLV